MTSHRSRAFTVAAGSLICFALHAANPTVAATQPRLEPIRYAVAFDPKAHLATVDATFPTEGRPSVDVMMAIWSPGFYRIENYATRIQTIAAKTASGGSAAIEQTSKNRWRIDARNAQAIVVSYQLLCNERSVTTNSVNDEFAVLNGAATFVTLAGAPRRPHDVRLELPSGWARSMTALEPAADGAPNHYLAEDFDRSEERRV